MAVLVTRGRAKLAELVKAQALFFAWGSGEASWDSAQPGESILAEGLTTELGRVAVSVAAYAEPDEAGDIQVPTGRFVLTDGPSNHLYLRCDFGYEDAPDAVIREVGLFTDTIVSPGLPEGRRYYTPSEIDDPGAMLALEHFPGVPRNNMFRQQFEFVLTL